MATRVERFRTGPVKEDRRSRVTINILGEDYVIKGDADPEYIKRVAKHVDDRLRMTCAAHPRLPRSHAMVLTCLNLMDELEKLRLRYEELLRLIEEAR